MIFYGILYFFTLEVCHLGKNQYIKKKFCTVNYICNKNPIF